MNYNHQILVLENNYGSFRCYTRDNIILNYDFHFVHCLEDCLSALKMNSDYTLLLADTDTEDMNTADYCSKFRALNQTIPIFFIGDYNTKPDAFQISLDLGNDFYFSKPTAPQILLSNMNTVIYMDKILEIYKKKFNQ